MPSRLNPVVVAVVVVVVLAVGALGSIVAVAAQGDREVSAQRGGIADYTPPALASPSPSPLPVVAVVGDGAVDQSVAGVDPSERWPARLAESQRVRVSLFADQAAGYTEAGSDGRTFVDQASRVPRDAVVVMFVGGARDRAAEPLELIRAVSDAIAAAKKRAPSASILVVGPFVSGTAMTAELEMIDNILQNAASISDATFADPIGQRWISGLTRTSGRSLTLADERRIGGRLENVVQQLLNGD